MWTLFTPKRIVHLRVKIKNFSNFFLISFSTNKKSLVVFPTRSQLNARICDNIVAIVFGSTTTRSGAFVFLDLEVLVLFAGVY